MVFVQEDFNAFVIANGIVGLKESPITLKSGRKSHWYVNWRDVVADVWGTDHLTDHILDFADGHDLNPDCFYGIPEGATKAAIIATYKLALKSPSYGPGSHALPMGRSTPKEHGAFHDRYFVGKPKGRTVVIEDTTTTGDSLITGLQSLLEGGFQIVGAIGLTNRMERRDDGRSVQEAVEALKVPYFAMSTADQLMPQVIRKANPSPTLLEALKAERAKYGINPLVLE